MLNHHNVSIRVMGEIYRALILATIVYGFETKLCKEDKRFHDEASAVNHEDQLQDKVTNIKDLKRAGLISMEDLIIRKKSPLERKPFQNAN